MHGSRRSMVKSLRSFTCRHEEQSRGTRKVSLQSLGIVLFLIRLCVSLHCSRIGFGADSDVLSLGYVMFALEYKKSIESSTLLHN